MGREKSDDRVVPQAPRKFGVTARSERGGKAVTASEFVDQLNLFGETAENPKGGHGKSGRQAKVKGGPATSRLHVVPQSRTKVRQDLPAMSMEEVTSWDNMMSAFKQVASNKGAPGPDRQSIGDVRKNLVHVLRALQRSLLNGTYMPGAVRRVWIPKGGGGRRGLGIPNVVDRIAQQAVYQVLSPHYEQSFHPSSHGFRPKRSCHTAIAEARTHIEAGYTWVVDFDLEKFFDRVNHQRLLARLGQRVFDPRLLQSIHRMLKAAVVMPDGVVVRTEEGTPQGGPLSPLLSNIVLDELDWELERRGHHFVRYADDSNIYVRSERSGQRVMASVTQFIERRLRLKVNESKSAVGRPADRHFLGFRIMYSVEGNRSSVRLSERSVLRLWAKVKELTPRNWGQSLDACITRLNRSLEGWLQFYHPMSPKQIRLLRYTDAHIRRRLRAIQLRHWRRRRTIARRLIQLGVRRNTAWRLVYAQRRKWWVLSGHAVVGRVLNVAHFEGRGLMSLEHRWRELYSQHLQRMAPAQLELALG